MNFNKLNEQLTEKGIDTEKIITASVDNGGVVTFQISDVLEYIFYENLTHEIEFIEHLLQRKEATQESIDCLLRHFLFERVIASRFVAWKRGAMTA